MKLRIKVMEGGRGWGIHLTVFLHTIARSRLQMTPNTECMINIPSCGIGVTVGLII